MSFSNAVFRVLVSTGLMASLALGQERAFAGPEAMPPDSALGRDLPPEIVIDPVARPAAPLDAAIEARNRRARDLRSQGNTLYHIGTASWVLGVGGMIVAAGTDNTALGNVSGLAYLAGLPLLGIGSSQVYRAYRIQDPNAPGDGREPWFWYGLGWASQFAGAAFITAGVVATLDDIFAGEEDAGNDGAGLILAGMGLAAGGLVMHVASWYQFSARRSDANAQWSVSLEPIVPLSPRGYADGAGLRLKVAF